MTKIMKGGVAYNTTSNMVALTQAEYNSLSSAQKNNGNFYFITDSDPSYFSASNIDYSNTTSGLTATNVQSAVDEIMSTSSVITPTLNGVSTSTAAGEVCKYWKSGKVVTITFDLIMATASSATTIFTLRQGYMPPEQITLVATAFTSSTSAVLRYCQIYANGNVVIYSQDQSRLLFTVTYAAA